MHISDKPHHVMMGKKTLSCPSLSTRWSLCSSVDKLRGSKDVETHIARQGDEMLPQLRVIMSFVWEV